MNSNTRNTLLLLTALLTVAILSTVVIAQSTQCTYLYFPSNGPRVEGHAGDECNIAASQCSNRAGCTVQENGCNMKNPSGIALQYTTGGVARCPDIPYNRFGPGSARGERMVAESPSITAPPLPQAPDTLVDNGQTYALVLHNDPSRNTGELACGKQGLQFNGYVYQHPSLCQRFYPSANVDTVSSRGDTSAVLCNGPPQAGICDSTFLTCVVCPSCSNTVTGNTPIGTLYAAMFAQCIPIPITNPGVSQPAPFNPPVVMDVEQAIPKGTVFPGEQVSTKTSIDIQSATTTRVANDFVFEYCVGDFDFVGANHNVKAQQTVATPTHLTSCSNGAVQIIMPTNTVAGTTTFVDVTLKVESDQSSPIAVGLRRNTEDHFGDFAVIDITEPWKVGPINDPVNAAALGVNPGDEIPIEGISDLFNVLAVTDLLEGSPGLTIPFTFPANVRIGSDLMSISQQPSGDLLLSKNVLQTRNTDILCSVAVVNKALRDATLNSKVSTLLSGCQMFPVTVSGLIGSIPPAIGGSVTGPTTGLGNPGSSGSSGSGGSGGGSSANTPSTRGTGSIGGIVGGGTPGQIVQGATNTIVNAANLLAAGPRAAQNVVRNVANVLNPADLTTLTPPSCADNSRNQGETGVDCGGPCASACTELPASPLISRIAWLGSFLLIGLLLAVLVVILVIKQRTHLTSNLDSHSTNPATSQDRSNGNSMSQPPQI